MCSLHFMNTNSVWSIIIIIERMHVSMEWHFLTRKQNKHRCTLAVGYCSTGTATQSKCGPHSLHVEWLENIKKIIVQFPWTEKCCCFPIVFVFCMSYAIFIRSIDWPAQKCIPVNNQHRKKPVQEKDYQFYIPLTWILMLFFFTQYFY